MNARHLIRGGGTTRTHGFTLVKLVVVIGIIALLISILLPALGKARRLFMDGHVAVLKNLFYQGASYYDVWAKNYIDYANIYQADASPGINDPSGGAGGPAWNRPLYMSRAGQIARSEY